MTFLAPQSDRAVRSAVEAFIEGKLRPQVEGEAVFETRNSRYRLIDGTLYSSTDSSLVGAELVGWLTEIGDESHVAAWWRPGVRAVLVDRRNGRHIVVTSATRLLRVEGTANPAGSTPHLGGSVPSHGEPPPPMGWVPSTAPIGPNAPAYASAASPIPYAPAQPQPPHPPPAQAAAPARDPRSLRPSSPADPHPAAPAMAIPPAPPIPRIIERPATAPPHPPPRPIASPPRPGSRAPATPPRPSPARPAAPEAPMAAQRALPRPAPPPTKGPLPRFPTGSHAEPQDPVTESSVPSSDDNAPTQRRLPNLAATPRDRGDGRHAAGDRDALVDGRAPAIGSAPVDRAPRSNRPRPLAPPPGPMAAPRSGRAAPPGPLEGAPLSRPRPAPMR